MSKILRDCTVCGTDLVVTVSFDGTYDGAHYFGTLLDEIEYWECDECYTAAE